MLVEAKNSRSRKGPAVAMLKSSVENILQGEDYPQILRLDGQKENRRTASCLCTWYKKNWRKGNSVMGGSSQCW